MANRNPSVNKRKEPIRTPLSGLPLYRSSDTTRDQQYINCFVEHHQNPKTGASITYLIKRPGLTFFSRPPNGGAEGRGVYSWRGDLYSVFGNQIYKNSVPIGPTLTTNTGHCGFVETSAVAANKFLAVSDGIKLYLINTAGAVSTITNNVPTPNLTSILFFDGYTLLATSDGKIWNSAVEDPTSWSTSSFISAEMYPDDLIGIARQNNLLVALGAYSTEFFYDAGNPIPGSFMGNLAQGALQVGCASKETIMQHENLLIWVGQEQTGGFTVQKLEGTTNLSKVSTGPIERILNDEKGLITQAHSYSARAKGHFFYILNLHSTERTLCYDIREDHWTEFQSIVDNSVGAGYFPFVWSIQHGDQAILQHETNGKLYILDEDAYQDDGQQINVSIRTARNDYDTALRKTCSRIELVGDWQPGPAPVSIQYSDDDYQTFSQPRYVDMGGRSWLQRLGNFRRRAWLFTHSANTDLRLEAFEADIQPQEY